MYSSTDPIDYDAMAVALQESEERYLQLVNTHPDALLIHTEGKIVFVNPSMLRLLGAAEDTQLLGQPVLSLLHPDCRPTVQARIEAINNGRPVSPTAELKYLAIDGSALDVEVAASACRWHGKRAIQVMIHDLRARRRAEERAIQPLEALRKREAQLQGLLAHTPSVVFIKDREGRFEFINRAYETLYGVRSEDVVGKTDYDIFPKQIADGFRLNDHEVMRTGQALEAEETVPREGGYGTHHTVKFPILAAGDVTGVGGIATDITLRRQAEIAIARSEARMAEAQRLSRAGSWEYDVATGKILWSEELFRQFGLDPNRGEPDAETYMTFYHPEDADLLRVCGEQAIHQGIGGEVNIRGAGSKGQRRAWYHVIVNPVRDAEGNVVRLVGTHMDITERKEIEQQLQATNRWLTESTQQLQIANVRLETLATTDGLTGLKNHRAFQDQLREEVLRASRYGLSLSMLMVDVDLFKAYNDTFGHPAGDTVLRQVAEFLRGASRAHDYVARYGGEEFAVILTGADSVSAVATAERLRAAIEAAPWPKRAVTVSVGVATLSLSTDDTTALIAQADTALYASKRDGRNCVTFVGFPSVAAQLLEVSA